MDEGRLKLLRWVRERGGNKALSPEDNTNYEELKRILELAPLNLSYSISQFREETRDAAEARPYMSIYVDYGKGPRAIEGWRWATLDGGNFGPAETAIILETA